MFLPILFFLILGMLFSWGAILALRAKGIGMRAGGEGQYHHTHSGVVPRIGGIGLIVGLAATYAISFWIYDPADNETIRHFGIFFGAVCAFAVGWIDDFKPLGAKVKLLAQIVIGLLLHEFGVSIDQFNVPFLDFTVVLGPFAWLATVVWVVAFMNLVNLIDGLDGLAGGIGLMLMILLAYLGYEVAVPFSTVLALGMAGALIGFLFHNFPPAKVYMGDSGAYLVGYLIAALAIYNTEKSSVLAALFAPVLAMALPIVDVSFAILRRGMKGLPLFRPDRKHIHHRLIQAGLSHRNTVLALYGLSLIALVVALLNFAEQQRYLGIFLGFAFVVVLFALRGHKISGSLGSLRSAVNESFGCRQDARNALYLRDWLIIEAERADSIKNLWSDFRFVLKKMGFCRAELTLGEETRSFFVPQSAHDEPEALYQDEHRLNGDSPGVLRLYAERGTFSEAQFELLVDVAAEAWTKAAARWSELHGKTATFNAVAQEAESYRAQKLRSQYRPTY